MSIFEKFCPSSSKQLSIQILKILHGFYSGQFLKNPIKICEEEDSFKTEREIQSEDE